MSHHATHARPALPSAEQIRQLPPDGGEGWNRLVFEQSPYLLQHAANPVDWHPWGEPAFEKARREDKPVFLSIGYSTCHWCHVMERESFEDAEVAALLNEHFVAIKVDREERPDIDQVYMTVTQALTGQGGWPMTVVLTPDKKPFFAGTYFPKRGGHGRPGMMELIPALGRAWKSEREEILHSADHIATVIGGLGQGAPGDLPGRELLDRAFEVFESEFDSVHGGFGGGRNKFPTPHNLSFLLRYAHTTGTGDARRMVELTLEKMRLGGIFDHVGFGFHRYSTDQVWLLPHFEKMLYDQAMLAIAYVDALQATGREDFANTAREIFAYVLRDMTAPEGAFYCAEDADSEGVEGKFYLWTPQELREVLDEADAALFARVYHIEPDGNFREESTGQKSGESIPHLRRPIREIAADEKMDAAQLAQRLEAIRVRLFAAREKRIHPHKDDKILTDWNGLMIAALARGAAALDSPEYAAAAARAADFLLTELRTADGRLLKRYRAGHAGLPATLEDFAFLAWGLLELYQATFEVRWLEESLGLVGVMLDFYWDEQHGGFFMTARDAEQLLVRSKDAYDGAIPSGNAVAAGVLARLGRLTGDAALTDKARRTVAAFAESLDKVPHGHAQMLIALDFLLAEPVEIVLAGDAHDAALQEMARAARQRFLPHTVLLHRPVGEDAPIVRLAPFPEAQLALDGAATGYVCRNYACRLPARSPEEFERRLAETLGPHARH